MLSECVHPHASGGDDWVRHSVQDAETCFRQREKVDFLGNGEPLADLWLPCDESIVVEGVDCEDNGADGADSRTADL